MLQQSLLYIIVSILSSSYFGNGLRFRPEAFDGPSPAHNPNDYPETIRLSDHEIGFKYDADIVYFLVTKELTWYQSQIYCRKILEGRLARIETLDQAEFIGSVIPLMEHLISDHFWIGARQSRGDNQFHWGNTNVEVPEQLLKELMHVRDMAAEQAGLVRNCLAIFRENHEIPRLINLGCKNLRSFVCEYREDICDDNATTTDWIPAHPDWEYKIFGEWQPYSIAEERCFSHDQKATLAYIPNALVANILKRYLLVGRPSLENAWIGGKHDGHGWKFVNQDKYLPNDIGVDESGASYPPWRLGRPRKKHGCLLLDRHLTETVYFIEARCIRLKPYICSRRRGGKTGDSSFEVSDVGGLDYRLFFPKFGWYEAQAFCETQNGTLAEPRSAWRIGQFTKLFGENKTSVNHVWIGGLYNMEDQKWHYPSDDSLYDSTDFGSDLFVTNITYFPNVETKFTCLNFDRERHNEVMLYGAHCAYPQVFMCEWPVGKMPPKKVDPDDTKAP